MCYFLRDTIYTQPEAEHFLLYFPTRYLRISVPKAHFPTKHALLLQHFPATTFRATIDQNTVGHTFENYLFAISQGFRNIFMTPNAREEWSLENKNILKREVEKIYWFIANSFCNGEMPINFSMVNDSFIQV